MPGPAQSRAATQWGNLAPPPSTLSWEQAARGEDGPNDYDPDCFYVRATNKKGFGERCSFRIPPNIYARIQEVVHDDTFPDYKMPADFIRDSIVHGLERRVAQINDPRLRERWNVTIQRLAFAEFSARMKEEIQHWEAIVTDVHESMTRLARDEAWGQAWLYLENAENLIDPCPDPYRKTVMEMIDEWREKVPREYRVYS